MNIENLIPKDKFDTKSIEQLKTFSIEQIRPIVPKLLIWTQDGNWPNSGLIMDYFRPHINEIDEDIIKILNGNDVTWKYWILLGLINDSVITPNDKILSTLKQLVNNPTEEDKDEELDILSKEILVKFHKNW